MSSPQTQAPRGLLPQSWRVQLPVFEGPLDLLLHLIKINEVEITDIPVALVCDQFHEYLSLMEELDLDIAGEYIYEAALLIQLKSRMLLPRPTTEAAQGEEEDPRRDLVERLLEYRRLKEAAQTLAEVHLLRQGIWLRQAQTLDRDDEDDNLDLSEVSLYDLLTVFREVMNRYDREHPDPIVLRTESFPIRPQIDRLLSVMEPGRPFDLLDNLLSLSCRGEVIAAFLAVLELARLHLVRLHQTKKGEILLYRTTRALQVHELEALEA